MRAKSSLKPPRRSRRLRPRTAVLASVLAALLAAPGCMREEVPEASPPRIPREVRPADYLEDTVGQVARFAGREWLPVRGYGFVTGLDGTGTTTVPPGVRQEVLTMMRRHHVAAPDALLASPDTAVVAVGGSIPPGAARGERFDLQVRALPGTETTSLDDGFLLECDLTRVVMTRGGGNADTLALGRGSIFVSLFGGEGETRSDPRLGRVLAGGKTRDARSFHLVLLEPSIRVQDQIVRLINSRFPDVAEGKRDGRIDLTVPAAYVDDKTHFLDVVGALYLRESPAARDRRLNVLVETLRSGRDMDRVSLCLEAFGAGIVPRLRDLKEHPSEGVRFFVGRTLARLQDAQAVHVLEPLALDPASEFQEEAVRALGALRKGLGLGVLSRALDTPSARVRVVAWQAIAKLSPAASRVERFRDKFTLYAVPTRADPFVYVSRTMDPEIAVFGDVRIRPPVLAETRRVTATATAEAGELILMARRRRQNLRIDVPLDLTEAVVRAAQPVFADELATEITGLDLGYGDVVGLISRMAAKKALTGPMILQPLEYQIRTDRPSPRPIETGTEP